MNEEVPVLLYALAAACGGWALVLAIRTGRMPWGNVAAFDISREKFPVLFWFVFILCGTVTLAALIGLLTRLGL